MRRLALLLVLLTGCLPVSNIARDVSNDTFGDDATLRYCLGSAAVPCMGAYGFAFDPGSTEAAGVILDVLGGFVTSPDARCAEVGDGLQCALGEVLEPTVVAVSGLDVTATATYRRAGEARIYQEVVNGEAR